MSNVFSIKRLPTSVKGFLTKEECQAVFERCVALSTGGGKVRVAIHSRHTSGVQWARNRAHLAHDVHYTDVWVTRTIRGSTGFSWTTQLDDAGLLEAVRLAERSVAADVSGATAELDDRPPLYSSTAKPVLWSDATYAFDGEKRGTIARQVVEPAEAEGLLSAGELVVQANGYATFSNDGLSRYYPTTRIVFTTTVRDAKGTGSGWAGVDDFDIARVDVPALGRRALEKCRTSINPVAIEPGRYTVVLEPQAVADLIAPLSMTDMPQALRRTDAERGMGPFAKQPPGKSKIGDRVLDPRLTWSADPMDPIGGFLPFNSWSGNPYLPVKWIENGILRQLSYEQSYGLWALGRNQALLDSKSWRLSGGETAIEEMIASTRRGLLVTRLHGVQLVDYGSFTCTGYTRDGVWLIENGKITKPVKNFRFTESPLFTFNKLDQLGPPQRVYSGDTPGERAWVAPAAKVHDFNFTQLADAV